MTTKYKCWVIDTGKQDSSYPLASPLITSSGMLGHELEAYHTEEQARCILIDMKKHYPKATVKRAEVTIKY